MLAWLDDRLLFTKEHWLEMLLTIGAAISMAFLFTIFYGWRFAHAQDYGRLETNQGVICYTSQQVETYLSFEGDTNASLAAVNQQGVVCTDEHVQFVIGDLIKLVSAKHGMWHVTEIGVVAIGTQRGYKYLLKPEVLYTAFMEEKESVADHFVEPNNMVVLVQHNHSEGHPDYLNWASGRTSNCCNEKDCGDLDESEVRETPTGTEVLVHVQGQKEKWCPVLKEHFITKGKSPDWSKPHACIIQSGWVLDECQRFVCYAGKGGI